MSDSTPRAIDRFHECATAAGLEYLIIGGYAVAIYGRPRFTEDIDYVVEASAFSPATDVLRNMKYVLRFATDAFAQFDPPAPHHPPIDLMLVDRATWEKLKRLGSTADFGGPTLYPVVHPIHLLAMKLHSAKQPERADRHKDYQDIVEIMLRQEISFQSLREKGILDSCANQETIDEVAKRLKEHERSKT